MQPTPPEAPKSNADRNLIERRVITFLSNAGSTPPGAQIQLTKLEPAALPGWLDGHLDVAHGGRTQGLDFLVTSDGRYLLRGEIVDLSVDSAAAAMAKLRLTDQPTRGDSTAPVTIVEFTDFQCPYCAKAAKTISQALIDAYPGKVKIVHKDFPLTQIHAWSEEAALAGECAFQLGNNVFWKLHDGLFEQQRQITAKNLNATAMRLVRKAGGDSRRYNKCVAKRAALDAVHADVAEATALGVNSTPTFFINGRRVFGVQPIEAFKIVIDDELSRR